MGKHICKFCIHCDSMSSDTPLYDYYVCPYCEGVFRPFRQVECSHYVDIHTGETDSGSTTSSSYSSSSSSSYTSSTPRKKTLAELHPKESKQFQIKAKFAIVLGFLPVVFAIALAFVLFLKPIGLTEEIEEALTSSSAVKWGYALYLLVSIVAGILIASRVVGKVSFEDYFKNKKIWSKVPHIIAISLSLTVLVGTIILSVVVQTYPISYHLNGGTLTAGRASIYSKTDRPTFAIPSKTESHSTLVKLDANGTYQYETTTTEYAFLGWYADEALTQPITACPASGAVDLYAKWSTEGTNTVTSGVETLYTIDGNSVYFGAYPQTQVTDSALINALNEKAGDVPTLRNTHNWMVYENYLLNEKYAEYAWYIDVQYEQNTYRGLYFTIRRTSKIDFATKYVYWFKYEPIQWDVLQINGSQLRLMASKLLDAQAFQDLIDEDSPIIGRATSYNASEGVPKDTLSDNYEYCTLRKWLNNDFYSVAFSSEQRAIMDDCLIKKTTHIKHDLTDKVCLPSNKDFNTRKSSIGFKITSTDYARSQGCFLDDSWMDYNRDGNSISTGVAPVIIINIE